MKKIVFILLAAALVFVVAVRLRGVPQAEPSSPKPEDAPVSEALPESAPEPAPEPTPEPDILLFGEKLAPDTAELELCELGPEGLNEALEVLPQLSSLEKVLLSPADEGLFSEEDRAAAETGLVMGTALSPADIAALRNACSGVDFSFRFLLYGQELGSDAERLEYESINIGDTGLEYFRQLLPCLPKLTYLKLDSCETSSEAMAALRDEFPGVKVVWRIWFSNYGQCGDGSYAVYNTLTDTEKIWATGTCRDETVHDLMYCTDVKYLDMGHNVLTDISFIYYMPKLEVAVLSITYVEDISPLANCPELEYLELFRTYATDLSPLANCQKLEHLYVYDEHRKGLTDLSPVLGLENLKRFYCTVSPEAEEQAEEFQRLHPDCECDFSWVFIGYTKWRTVNGQNTERYELLRQQMGYDTYDMSK